jgi:hypothetical protein
VTRYGVVVGVYGAVFIEGYRHSLRGFRKSVRHKTKKNDLAIAYARNPRTETTISKKHFREN